MAGVLVFRLFVVLENVASHCAIEADESFESAAFPTVGS
jgi:hypothetical protein